MESRHWHRHWVTCPHSRGLLLAGRFDFLAGYLARGSVSEGERRGSVLLAALLMLTRRLFPAGRARVAWGSGSGQICTVAPGGARSPLGELGRPWGSSVAPGELRGSSVAPGRATSGGARSPHGGARSPCFVPQRLSYNKNLNSIPSHLTVFSPA